ncbi:hypothetical protein ACIRD3_14435 [Kitasatospora sp. NPDC093550]|uniref:hypothetical protein n=1 Tax=Kitasatospora sp. NPDC093550 TaxID=3364089 RepID=UPI00382ADB1E
MKIILSGFRVFVTALVEGDPLWPAGTLFLGAIVTALVIAAVRASRAGVSGR